MALVDRRAARRALLKRIGTLACGALAVPTGRALGEQGDHVVLPRIDDLRTLAAQMRRERIPLLLFFSTPGCPFCLEVRRNYLAPRLKDDAGRLLIREVDITSPRGFAALDGTTVTEVDLAARFKVRIAPVVQLVDASLARLGRPLVGINDSGFYEAYLSRAIDEAQRAIRGR